jgi:hypothetical protein
MSENGEESTTRKKFNETKTKFCEISEHNFMENRLNFS